MSQSYSHKALDADVIIIGAGIAGMTTAYALLKKEPSLNIMVLEASNRVGGRTSTKALLVKNSDFHLFDFGGQWINSQQCGLLNLMQDLDIKTQQPEATGKIIIDFNGKQHKENKSNPFSFCTFAAKLELANFIRNFEALCKKPSINVKLASQNMHEFIEKHIKHDSNKAILESMVLMNCGVDATQITVGFYVFFCISTHGITNQLTLDGTGMREMWLQDGAQEICNKLAILLQHDIAILTNTKIMKIICYKDNVQLTSPAGTFFSKKAVVAVPPMEILKMEFEPPLSEAKTAALNSAVSGHLSKFVVTYEDAFWRKMGCSGDIYVLKGSSPSQPLLCCHETTSENKPALTGYLVQYERDLKKVVLLQMSKYFGQKALSPVYFGAKTWGSGSPMCCYPAYQDVCEVIEQHDGIFWAGAEASVEWYGTMCGAVLSGFRTAHDILYDIHPSILSPYEIDCYGWNLSMVQRHTRSHNSVFKKLVNPYYQISALLIVTAAAVILWRKVGLSARLKNILTKK